jgi:hypothetical protein
MLTGAFFRQLSLRLLSARVTSRNSFLAPRDVPIYCQEKESFSTVDFCKDLLGREEETHFPLSRNLGNIVCGP